MSAFWSLHAAIDRLESQYGVAVNPKRFESLDELVCCILSQHTSDAISLPTFEKLKQRFPTWTEALEAGAEAVEEAIRAGGLARPKARSIHRSLERIQCAFGELTLNALAQMTDGEAERFLTSLPGVGPKTAAIVLSFSLGRNILAVDTHVHRIAKRLGWVASRSSAEKAYEILQRLLVDGIAYRAHMALIRHGREICTARRPRCESCVLNPKCHFALSASGLEEACQ